MRVYGIWARVSTDICIMVGKSRGQPSNLSLAATRLQIFIPMAILLLLSVFGVSICMFIPKNRMSVYTLIWADIWTADCNFEECDSNNTYFKLYQASSS